MPEWTFLTTHASVLSLISRNPRATGLELSSALGITERAVRKIIADLYHAGYIEKKKEGRGIRYRINHNQKLRQDTHQDVAIGDILESLG